MDTRPSMWRRDRRCRRRCCEHGDRPALDAVGMRARRAGVRRGGQPVGRIPLVDLNDAPRLDHTASAGTVRHRRLRPPIRRADRAASIGTGGRRERVRRHQTVPRRRSDASDQLASIGPDRRTEGQFDVGGSRHPCGPPDRRHRRLRCQRGDRRPRVESRRRGARRRCDRRVLRATRRPCLAADVRVVDDPPGATGHRAGPTPPNTRVARPGDAREIVADRCLDPPAVGRCLASTRNWS